MIIARAPFRVSFFGGGTDHPEFFNDYGGAVLGTAINKYSYIVINEIMSDILGYKFRLSYSKIELLEQIEEIEHNIFREALRWANINSGIAIHSILDLPALSGLGASSALSTSVILGLSELKRVSCPKKELAIKAIALERDMVKASVGYQDQIFSSYGGFNLIKFNKGGDFEVESLHMTRDQEQVFNEHLLLVYTNVNRVSSDLASRQVSKVSRNINQLIEMREMAFIAKKVLFDEFNLYEFGTMLRHGWELKKSLDEKVTTDEVNTIYDIGIDNGAYGGKLLGAGGGGFVLFFAPPDSHNRIISKMTNRRCLSVSTSAPGAEIVFSQISESV